MGMVELKCPNCGASIELDESREFGFCQYCGTRVVQDKLIIEHRGSVTIDTSEELKNLYVLAHRAKENGDTDNAQKYYEQIIVKDPTSWEANFYTVYYQSLNCVIANIKSSAINMTNNLDSTFRLVKDNYSDESEQRNIISEIVHSVMVLSTSLLNGAINYYNGIDQSVRAQYKAELDRRKNACVNLCYYCGNCIEVIFGTDFIDLALIVWKDGVKKSGNQTNSNPYCKKIKQYDPDFKIKKPKFVIIGLPIIWFIALCLIYSEVGSTWAIVFLVVSILAVIGYVVWLKVIKKKKNTK